LENVYTATGKRKNAIARVILKPGKGERIINGSIIKDYLKSDVLLLDVEQPFEVLQTGSSFDVVAQVQGGGLSGQTGRLSKKIACKRLFNA
jgi:small subunit ribosomal protein S9